MACSSFSFGPCLFPFVTYSDLLGLGRSCIALKYQPAGCATRRHNANSELQCRYGLKVTDKCILRRITLSCCRFHRLGASGHLRGTAKTEVVVALPSERIEFTGARNTKLAAQLDWPEGAPRASALFAHCFTCTKDIYAASRICAELAENGLAVLRFDFTGLGASEGDFGFSLNLCCGSAYRGNIRARRSSGPARRTLPV